mgnify:CR=1 FL=1
MRHVALLFLIALAVVTASAQFTITASKGFGPFSQGLTNQNTFGIGSISAGNTVDSAVFQITAGTGSSVRTVASQRGTQLTFTTDMGALPWSPEPQLMVVAYMRNQSGTPITVTRTAQITITAPTISFTSSDGFGPVIVGKPHTATITASSLPTGTTRVTIVLTSAAGSVVAQRDSTGINIQQSTLSYSLAQYPGELTASVTVRYAAEPPNGYTLSTPIADSLIPARVEASAGFGPFAESAHVLNTFVVKGLGAGCTTLQWIIQYNSPFGVVRTPVDVTRTYDAVKDSMHFVYDMRDVSPGSILRVLAKYGAGGNLTAESIYPLNITTSPNPPRFRINDSIPIVWGRNVQDTIIIDSLPARITWSRVSINDGTGAQIASQEITTGVGAYQDSVKLDFSVSALRLGTAIVRLELQNDMSDDITEYDYLLEVRDTSTFFLFADQWGPFVQTDSGTITPGVTDVRPFAGAPADAILGRFTLVDTNDAENPLFTSPFLDLSGVTSRDSLLYWPDAGYTFGSSNYTRVQIPTASLPLSSEVRFERLIVRGTDTTADKRVSHPVLVVPSPGILSSAPRLDSFFVVTRNNPVIFTIDSLPAGASKVIFKVFGTADATPVDQQAFTVTSEQTSVSWSTDVGRLPVNAQLTVSVVSPGSNDNGTTLVRSINTVPDTLSFTSTNRIDTIVLDWQVDQTSNLITGVVPVSSVLTFSKIPAQTRWIEVVSVADNGSTIDSTRAAVPYRVAYTPSLTVQVPISLSAHNIVELVVRYISDGGPRGGIVYRRPITVRPANIGMYARKIDPARNPPQPIAGPLRQGSTDILDVAAYWAPRGVQSNSIGLSAVYSIDSVSMRVLVCNNHPADSANVRPTPAQVKTGVLADTVYSVSKLPLASNLVELTVYSRSLRLPSGGVRVTAPISFVPAPVFNAPYGFSYPSFRVTDTVAASLTQNFYLTSVDGIFEVDSTQILDKNGAVKYTFATQVPMNDTIRYSGFDVNTLEPDLSPFTVIAIVRTESCGIQSSYTQTLAKIETPRVFADPPSRNWIYSSKGWGPFQQGRGPSTYVTTSFDPSQFIPAGQRGGVSDEIRVSIVGVQFAGGVQDSIVTPEFPTTYTVPAASPLPQAFRTNTTISLNALDTTASLALHIVWLKHNSAGTVLGMDRKFKFPVTMLEFPDQPITAPTTGYEQSVLAGYGGTPVMVDNYPFYMKPASDSIDRLTFGLYNASGVRLDTFSIPFTSRNPIDTTSVFSTNRDVAQYPWPLIARNHGHVTIRVGYLFSGGNGVVPTKTQITGIDITPRADWLNGSTLTLDGQPTASTVSFKASIPMPTSGFSAFIPLFNEVFFGIDRDSLGNILHQQVDATYNTQTKQFSFTRPQPSANASWPPTISFFGGYNASYDIVVDDGSKRNEFTALRRFEEADNIPNRELRVRSLLMSKVTASKGILTFFKELTKIISELSGDAEDAETGGLVEVKPLFVLSASAQQISTVNLGTEESGVLQHVGEVLPKSDDEAQNEFPSSQAVAVSVTGGGGVEVSFIKGLAGLGVTVSETLTFATGEVYSGPVNSVRKQYYVPTLNPSTWLTIELSILWGLVKIDLFKGMLYHWTSPYTMPSFGIYNESWESIFKMKGQKLEEERTQAITKLAKLPDETPHYRPAPAIAATDSSMAAVWVEHSEVDKSGTLVIGHLNRSTHQFQRTAAIEHNRNGMHDPSIALIGNTGNAVVAWVQNSATAGQVNAARNIKDLMSTEDIRVAIVNSNEGGTTAAFTVRDPDNGRIDGKPSVAVSPDGTNALIAWPALATSSSSTDVYSVRLFNINGKWEAGDPRVISSSSGTDRDVHVGVTADGTYHITWINDSLDNGNSRVLSCSTTSRGFSSPEVVLNSNGDLKISDIASSTSGEHSVVVAARHHVRDSTDHVRELLVSTNFGNSWTAPEALSLDDPSGYIRHLDVATRADGSLCIALDVFDRENDAGKRGFITISGSVQASPDTWKKSKDNANVMDKENIMWAMRTIAGPDNTYYVISQELDSVRGNKQLYRNGLPVGPSRINTVLRSFTFDSLGQPLARRFGGQPVSVDEDPWQNLELSLRYSSFILNPAPNPAASLTMVPVVVQLPTHVRVDVVDVMGRVVATVWNNHLEEGIHGITVPVSELANGSYTLVLTDQLGTKSSVPLKVVH